MTGRRSARLLLALALLAPAGCASPGRSPIERRPDRADARTVGDNHADLERELTLYSD